MYFIAETLNIKPQILQWIEVENDRNLRYLPVTERGDKELQQEIDRVDKQTSNMKKHLSSIVREYKFDSVQAFNNELNASKREYFDYQAARAECIRQ